MADNTKNLLWWLKQVIVSVLAPLGVLGSPIGLAALVRGIVEWKGPIGYAVQFWTEYVSPPFAFVFGWIANLLFLPEPPTWLTDYLIMGFLVSSSYWRSWLIVPLPRDLHEPPRWWRFFRHIVLWPYGLYRTLASVRRIGVQSTGGLLLTFAPIAIFLILLIVNWAAL